MSNFDINEFYIAIGSKIRFNRLQRKIDQETFANQLNLTRASIVNIEKGRQRPSIHLLWHIAEIFQTNIIDLLPVNNNAVAVEDIKTKVKRNATVEASQVDTLINFLIAVK